MRILRYYQPVLLALFGFGGFTILWWMLTQFIFRELPAPPQVFSTLFELLKDPFYDLGPNDKGIGWQVYHSIRRVFFGFLIGSLIALPLGLLLGVWSKLGTMFNPIVQLLRPVSPLAWFPIGLTVFQSSDKAAVFTIAVTSLWPTLINTVHGAYSVPEEYKNVAKVFGFSRFYYLKYIVIPYTLPFALTGLRISAGIAWMVIVASEMLAGGTGIGFYIWDSWNALNLSRVMSAILIIGAIGFILDHMFGTLQRRFKV